MGDVLGVFEKTVKSRKKGDQKDFSPRGHSSVGVAFYAECFPCATPLCDRLEPLWLKYPPICVTVYVFTLRVF